MSFFVRADIFFLVIFVALLAHRSKNHLLNNAILFGVFEAEPTSQFFWSVSGRFFFKK